MHSFFGLKGNATLGADGIDNLRKKLEVKKVLIIDEKSFCAKHFLVKVSNILKRATGVNEVMGGVPCIWCGDLQQLNPHVPVLVKKVKIFKIYSKVGKK